MSRWDAYLNTGKNIVETYDGKVPLSAWLKDFFRQHKQMGSNDRKMISQAVYNFYRLGHSGKDLSTKEAMLTGLFLCNRSSSQVLAHFKPEWNDKISSTLNEKIAFLQEQNSGWNPAAVFPWPEALSSDVDVERFSFSHLIQPDLFLRIRPHHESTVRQKLTTAGISFNILAENCVSLTNATNIDAVLRTDREVVIQDYNSQRVGDFFALNQPVSLWDCCAGSGGKSIMAYDLNAGIHLSVTDTRPSILQNLQQRFARAGIDRYQSFVADLSSETSTLPPGKFDRIIADVPCSGSGTWARTPEQLYFFDKSRITHYSSLQKKIISRVIHELHDEGRLIYVTCSVFRAENEENVAFILQHFAVRLVAMELLTGYEKKADSLFVAVFSKV